MDTLVGILIDLMGCMEGRSEEFGSKNVIRALPGEGIMCVKYMV